MMTGYILSVTVNNVILKITLLTKMYLAIPMVITAYLKTAELTKKLLTGQNKK